MSVYSGIRPSTLLESGDIDFANVTPYNGSILELAAQAERNDMNMFEAVIELDFMEAAGMLQEADDDSDSTSDTAEKSIWEKLKDMLHKAWETFKGFISNIISKIQQLIANDAKLIKQYEKYWKTDNLAGFKIKGYTPIKELTEKGMIDAVNFEQLLNNAISKINAATSTDALATDYFAGAVKDIKGDTSWKDYFKKKYFEDKIDEETEFLSISPSQMNIVVAVLAQGKRTIASLKADANKVKKLYKIDAKATKVGKSGEKGLALAKTNAIYKVYNSMVKEISKITSAEVSCISTMLSSARKAYILGGKYAKAHAEGNKSEQTTAEMAMDSLLGEASDAYVESVIYGY